MGHVLTEAMVDSLADLHEVERGIRAPNQVRTLVLTDVLVSGVTTTLTLPSQFIQRLGLNQVSKEVATGAAPYAGAYRGTVCDPVRLTIQGRSCSTDVIEAPDDAPINVGQIPLTMLDLVVDLQGRALIGNPAHGGEHVLELY